MMDFTLSQFKENVEPFLDYRNQVGYTRPATSRSDATDLRLYTQFMEDHSFKKPDGTSMIAFQKYLAQQRNNMPASINRKIFTLRAFQSFLELKAVNNAHHLPFKKVLKIRAPRPYRANFLSQNEINTLFKAINTNSVLGLRDYALFALMFLLGLRVGEVHRLNCDDINWQNNTITVTGKCDRERTLSLNHEIKTILESYLAVRQYIFKASLTKTLFLSKKGRRIAIRTIEDNFKKLIKTAQIEKTFKVTPHTLRHTCATMLNEKGVKILTIQNILGHSNPNTAINYYLHTPDHIMRDALEKLPLTQYINQIIDNGQIRLSYQLNRYRSTG
jgi:site-specific recombinase XerD